MSRMFIAVWKLICTDLNQFNFYNINIYPQFFCSARKMDIKTANLNVLTKRLNIAESQLKKLQEEITSIRGIVKKVLSDKGNVSTVAKRQYSTDIVDMVDPKDFLDDMEEAQPAKRVKQGQNSQDFSYNEDHVIVYTDGACENNGKKGAKAGIGVWFGANHSLNVSAPVVGKATNNTAEIQACVKAIDVAYENGVRKLCIRTDSQFVINSMTSWIKKWKKNNWKLSTGGEVKNKSEFIKLDIYCNKMASLKWEHVAGHRGIVGNEGADQLARDGALAYVP